MNDSIKNLMTDLRLSEEVSPEPASDAKAPMMKKPDEGLVRSVAFITKQFTKAESEITTLVASLVNLPLATMPNASTYAKLAGKTELMKRSLSKLRKMAIKAEDSL